MLYHRYRYSFFGSDPADYDTWYRYISIFNCFQEPVITRCSKQISTNTMNDKGIKTCTPNSLYKPGPWNHYSSQTGQEKSILTITVLYWISLWTKFSHEPFVPAPETSYVSRNSPHPLSFTVFPVSAKSLCLAHFWPYSYPRMVKYYARHDTSNNTGIQQPTNIQKELQETVVLTLSITNRY